MDRHPLHVAREGREHGVLFLSPSHVSVTRCRCVGLGCTEVTELGLGSQWRCPCTGSALVRRGECRL